MEKITLAMKNQWIESLSQWKGKKVLIVGDVALDEYLLGQVRKISPEAPVPILEVEKQDHRLGMAANVAQNVVSLGGVAQLISVVGQDSGADLLRELFQKSGFSWQGIIEDRDRPTTRKTRVMAQHHHLIRVDYELRKYLSVAIEKKVLQKIEESIANCDIVILEDYAKGVISRLLIESLVSLCRKNKKKLLADPHRTNSGDFYAGVDLIKPNYDEAVALAGLDFDSLRENPNKVIEAGRALQKKVGSHDVVLTRGQEGMTIFSGEQITQVPTYARTVFDVTGAGDTVIATLALGLSSGLSLVESCRLANFAAGVVVSKVGCVPCEISELIDYIQTTH